MSTVIVDERGIKIKQNNFTDATCYEVLFACAYFRTKLSTVIALYTVSQKN